MYYEGCTLDEIRAYRELESQIFDFGEGEMEIEGWYGSEDAYLSMSLPECCGDDDYDNHINNLNGVSNIQNVNVNINIKCNNRSNSYMRKKIDKNKLTKLNKYGKWWTVGDRKGYMYRCYISKRGRAKKLKRFSNKKVRNYNCELSSGNGIINLCLM